MLYLREPFVGDTHAKHLLRVLTDYAGESCDCWPSQNALLCTMETSSRTLKRATAKLVERGLIIVYRPTRRRKSNRYRLRWAEIRDAVTAVSGEPRGQYGPTLA